MNKKIPNKIFHEGLSATNPEDMTCMFIQYFKSASNGSIG